MPHTPHITASSTISRIADDGMVVNNSRLVSSPNHSGEIVREVKFLFNICSYLVVLEQ